MKRTVFFVSDRTGITVKTLGGSLLTQFESMDLERVSIPYVDTPEKAEAAVRRIDAAAEADGVPALVFSTLIDPECRAVLVSANGVLFDFFDTFIGPLETALGMRSSRTVGRTHGMGNATDYQVRMNAVNYALNLDDGVHSGRLDQADVVLLGVSRSGKTPTCLYLGLEFGIHAANYPLTEEDFEKGRLPEAVRPLKGRLAGLTIAPERLHEIREERRAGSRYASLKQCRYEVDEAERLMRRDRIPIIDTTHASIEEIATMLVHEHGLRRRVVR
ncbi:MAG: pyruvate, water dikinase regulatory protein [Chromatiales bacterium]|jgi:regulator of PEP synthase PpsR (kinase-PPPase family)